MKLEPGDGFSTKGKGILGWISRNAFNPMNPEYHYGMICEKRADGDYNILESIPKGLSAGVLSMYDGQDLTFWRVNCPAELRHQAPDALREWGRARYDYFLFVKLFSGAAVSWLVMLWREHRLRKLRAEDFTYARNNALICTEAFQIAYLGVGVSIVDPEIVPIPSAFKQAELDGYIYKLDEEEENDSILC